MACRTFQALASEKSSGIIQSGMGWQLFSLQQIGALKLETEWIHERVCCMANQGVQACSIAVVKVCYPNY